MPSIPATTSISKTERQTRGVMFFTMFVGLVEGGGDGCEIYMQMLPLLGLFSRGRGNRL